MDPSNRFEQFLAETTVNEVVNLLFKEDKFKSLFINFLNEQNSNFTIEGIKERTAQKSVN